MKAKNKKKVTKAKKETKVTISEGESKVVFTVENEYNPNKNPDAISIIKQEDGNWKGWMNRFGTVVEVREIGPETVLKMLLTHNGA